MLETLLSVDQSVVTRLRHIRVRAFPFPLYASSSSNNYYPTYYAANALSLLPGLCLDTLVVEDCWHGFGMGDGWRDVTTYFDIESLLESNAWKEVTYLVQSLTKKRVLVKHLLLEWSERLGCIAITIV